MKYIDYIGKHLDRLEAVSEEIHMMLGLKCEVVDREIQIDTIAGKMIFSVMDESVMTNVWRFVNNYGMKLAQYGLKNKLESLK